MSILTDEEITAAEESAGRSYRRHKGGIRGQIVTPQDDYQWHYVRAIEAAVMSKLAEQIGSEPFGYYENGRYSLNTDGGGDKWRERNGYKGAIYTEAQLAAAQQKMAEACAKVCDKSAHEWRGANSRQVELANAIRNGEWRKCL